MSDLGTEKYLLLTTFRRSGEGVPTPVWVVPLSDGRLGFWTSSSSGKAKRIRLGARVTVQPCTMQGKPNPGTAPQEATAELIHDGPVFDEVHQKIKAKYGLMVHLTKFLGLLLGQRKRGQTYADAAVLISLPRS